MKELGTSDGVTSYYAEEEGRIIHGTIQDCTPLRERVREQHLTGNHGTREMKLAAVLPAALIEKYCNLTGIDFREFITNPVHGRRMCNDPDLRDWRVWPGHV